MSYYKDHSISWIEKKFFLSDFITLLIVFFINSSLKILQQVKSLTIALSLIQLITRLLIWLLYSSVTESVRDLEKLSIRNSLFEKIIGQTVLSVKRSSYHWAYFFISSMILHPSPHRSFHQASEIVYKLSINYLQNVTRRIPPAQGLLCQFWTPKTLETISALEAKAMAQLSRLSDSPMMTSTI